MLKLPYLDCIGIDSTSEVTFDLKAVFSALRFNTYFLSVELCDVTVGRVMELIADTLNHNITITTLKLQDLNGKAQYERMLNLI